TSATCRGRPRSLSSTWARRSDCLNRYQSDKQLPQLPFVSTSSGLARCDGGRQFVRKRVVTPVRNVALGAPEHFNGHSAEGIVKYWARRSCCGARGRSGVSAVGVQLAAWRDPVLLVELQGGGTEDEHHGQAAVRGLDQRTRSGTRPAQGRWAAPHRG